MRSNYGQRPVVYLHPDTTSISKPNMEFKNVKMEIRYALFNERIHDFTKNISSECVVELVNCRLRV